MLFKNKLEITGDMLCYDVFGHKTSSHAVWPQIIVDDARAHAYSFFRGTSGSILRHSA